jgi:hypothetical protein
MPIDFNQNDISKLNGFISGKTIVSILSDRDGMNDRLVFQFTDGSYFELEYDYIYSYEYNGARKKVPTREFKRVYYIDTMIGMSITRNGNERMYYANTELRRKRINAITSYINGE